MAIREIKWSVSKDLRSISPNTPQDGGVQGEHNVTKAVFELPEGCPLLKGYTLRFGWVNAAGGYDPTEPMTVEEGKVSFLLPRQWTQYGGTNTLSLVAEKNGEVAYTLDARVFFHSRQTALQEERKLVEVFMQQQCDAAAASAEEAADSAADAANHSDVAYAQAQAAIAAEEAADAQAQAAKQSAAAAATDSEDARLAMTHAEMAARTAESAMTNAATAASKAYEYMQGANNHYDSAAENAKAAEEAKAAAVRSAETASTAAQGAAAARSAAEQHAANASAAKNAAEKGATTATQAAADAQSAAEKAEKAAEHLEVDDNLDPTSGNAVANSAVTAAINEAGGQAHSALTGMYLHEDRLTIVEADVAALKENGGGTGGGGGSDAIGDTSQLATLVYGESVYYAHSDGTAKMDNSIETKSAYRHAVFDCSDYVGKVLTVTSYHTDRVHCFLVDADYNILQTYSATGGSSVVARVHTVEVTDGAKYILIPVAIASGKEATVAGLLVSSELAKINNRVAELESSKTEIDAAINKVDEFENAIAANEDAIGDTAKLATFVYGEAAYSENNGVAVINYGAAGAYNHAVFDCSDCVGKTLSVTGYHANNLKCFLVDKEYNILAEYTTSGASATAAREHEVVVTAGGKYILIPIYCGDGKERKASVDGLAVADELAKTIEQVDVLEEKTDGIEYHLRKVDVVCDTYSCGAYSETSDKIEVERYPDNYDEIYALYDSLVTAYPDYVSKEEIGRVKYNKSDVANIGNLRADFVEKMPDTEELPIYRYDFTPPLVNGGSADKVCKILYCSGQHGGERPPILEGARFFTDLCKNWRTQDLLRTLRFQVHFTVIPIENPFGIKYSRKTNHNGVNLGSNFSNEWGYVEDDGTSASNYSGESAASEVETQAIEAMIANERFDFGIDHHTFAAFAGAEGQYIDGWIQCNDVDRPHTYSFAQLIGTWISAKVVTKNPLVDDLSKSYFEIRKGGYWGHLHGAFPDGFGLETTFGWGDADMEAAYGIQKFNAEVLGAIFYSVYAGYHKY